jgi:hypothetical protein
MGLCWIMAVLANASRLQRDAIRGVASPISVQAVVEAGALSAIMLLALGLRLGPMQRGLTFDELFTAVNFVGAESVWKTVSTSINFNNHVGYSLLARLAVGLLGSSDWVLRLPALILGLLTLPVAWWLTRPLIGTRLALVVALALALAPEQIRWSTSARGYTGMMLGVLVASGLLFRLLHRPSRGLAVGLALVTALTIYVHLYATPVVGIQVALLAILWWRSRHDAGTRRAASLGLFALVGAGLLTLLLYLPIIPSLLNSVQHAGRGRPWLDFPRVVAMELTGAAPDWLLVVALLVAGLGAVKIGRRHRWLVAYGAAIAVVPVLVATAARPLDLYPRFFIYVLPFVLVALVVGGAALPELVARALPRLPKPLTWVPVAVGTALLLSSWLNRYPGLSSDEGFRDAAQALLAAPSEGVTRCAAGAGAELFRWYVPSLTTLPKSLGELRRATAGRNAAWCLYRPSSWESAASAEIRRYLQERGTVEQYGDVLLLREGGRR